MKIAPKKMNNEAENQMLEMVMARACIPSGPSSSIHLGSARLTNAGRPTHAKTE
jgi:hypothetical protein